MYRKSENGMWTKIGDDDDDDALMSKDEGVLEIRKKGKRMEKGTRQVGKKRKR